MSQLEAILLLRELCRLSAENFDDDLEERPMRHSIGNLSARLRAALRNTCEYEKSNEDEEEE